MSVIVHVSDMHFGGVDLSALDAVRQFVDRTRPDAVVATGDLALNGHAEELQSAFEWLGALSAPVVATPGNHDVPYHNLGGRLVDPFKRYRCAAEGNAMSSLRLPDTYIVTANTARGAQWRLNWAQGAISARQTDDVAASFEAHARPNAVRVLATHHPLDWPNDAPIQGRTRGGGAALRRLAGGCVDVFLCGHLHVTSARQTLGGAVAICGGTLSKRQRHEPCGFAVVSHRGRVLEVDLMQVRSGVAELASTRIFEICRRLQGNPASSPAFRFAERIEP